MTRRWAGVYSSSAVGSLGTMLITPPDTLNSTFCPLLRPARRRTLRGTTRSDLVDTTTPMMDKALPRSHQFHSTPGASIRQTLRELRAHDKKVICSMGGSV